MVNNRMYEDLYMKCEECSAEAGCATCQYNSQNCLSCLSDAGMQYKLVGNQCVSKKSISIKMVFNYSYSNFLKRVN